MPISIFQRSSCLVRNALCPDRQRIFICAGPSVIRVMKSDVCTGSLVRKLYNTCRCISEFLVNLNSDVEIRSILCSRFLVNQNPKLYPDRFRCLVDQNPKFVDPQMQMNFQYEMNLVIPFYKKKKRFLFPLLICLASVLSCPS